MHRSPLIFAFVEDTIGRWRAYRQNMKARRLIDNLPPQLRKDIGWPDALPDRARRN